MSQKYNPLSGQKKRLNPAIYPLIIILAVIPLIVRIYPYNTHLGSYPWSAASSDANDVFLYWKSMVFIVLNSIMALIVVYKLVTQQKKIKFSVIFIPLFIYALLALASSIFSPNAYFSFHGIYEQFESIWVLLSYCLTAYYAFLFISTEDDVKIIFRCLMIGIAVISLIGLSQLFSIDFYRTDFGKMTFLPAKNWGTLNNIDFNFDPGRVYMSLYNPNYVGTYVSLLTPILLVLILFNKNKKLMAAFSVLLLALLACLFGSQSRTGEIAVVVSLIFMIIIFHKAIFRHWKIFVLALVLILGILFIAFLTNTNLATRIKSIFAIERRYPPLSEIQTNDDNVTVVYNNDTLVIQFAPTNVKDNYQFIATDKNGTLLETQILEDKSGIIIKDPRFVNFVLAPVMLPEQIGFAIKINNYSWNFTNQTGDGTYYYFTNSGKLTKMTQSETVGFKGLGHFGSGRGYIWSKTVPLLKDNLILGTGADTFTLAFPNDDYVGMYNHGYSQALMTKPHSMYLQMGVQTGVLSLIAFLVFYFMYLVSSIKLYFRHSFDTYMSQIGAAILAGTVGYMVSGIANDSTIVAAPVFWALIGIGLGINYHVQKEKMAKRKKQNK